MKVVHVVGTGTIGEPLIGLLSDYKDDLGIDQVTFHKNTPLLTDRSKVQNLIKRGAVLTTATHSFSGFEKIGLNPSFSTEEAIERASVVVDCTPKGIGHRNKQKYYNNFSNSSLGFIAQGSEFGFGKMYARGINDDALIKGKDKFIHVVSCNTHNIASVLKTIAFDGNKNNLVSAKFNCIRRANDVSQSKGFIASPQVGVHSDEEYGTHHAKDASLLFNTMGYKLDLFSSAIKINTQYMHILHFNLLLNKNITMDEVINKFIENDRIAITNKIDSCEVFSFGRDHGHFGRILSQTVISIPSLHIKNNNELSGFCFTPQDGNSLLSSVSATSWFLNPDNYEEKIQCLKPFLFQEV